MSSLIAMGIAEQKFQGKKPSRKDTIRESFALPHPPFKKFFKFMLPVLNIYKDIRMDNQ